MSKGKIILDTNLWISFLISNNFQIIEELLEKNKIILLYSDRLISEIDNVINRPKFKKYFSKDSVELIYELFDKQGLLIPITSNILLCRDEKDNFLLNLAIDGNADYLITGDKDLLVLNKIKKTEIITISDFILKLN